MIIHNYKYFSAVVVHKFSGMNEFFIYQGNFYTYVCYGVVFDFEFVPKKLKVLNGKSII